MSKDPGEGSGVRAEDGEAPGGLVRVEVGDYAPLFPTSPHPRKEFVPPCLWRLLVYWHFAPRSGAQN